MELKSVDVNDRSAVDASYNAEVNGPMIAVNETLGFRAVECLGELQKRTESPSASGG